MVKELDSALAHYADIVLRDVSCGPRQSLDRSLAEFPGAGAAGGLGFGLMAFCGAEIRSGIESVLDMVRFEDLVKDADLVITGEGAIDHQTLFGKVPQGVTQRAKKVNPDVAVIAVAGTLGRDYEAAHSCGIDYMMSIATGPITLFDPANFWKSKEFNNVEIRPLLVKIFDKGECCYESPDLTTIRKFCMEQVNNLWDEVKRFENPHLYYVDLSESLWTCKQVMLSEHNIK
jgi:hypothetical protein